LTRFSYTIRNNHMHSLVLIFVGGFCLGLIAFAFQLINSTISEVTEEQNIQSIVGVSLTILSSLGFILTLLYFFLNQRFHRKKDWGGIEITHNELHYRFFNQWRFIEKSIDLSVLESVFVHTYKGQSAIQLSTKTPVQIFEIPCKNLSNEDLAQVLSILKLVEEN